MTRVSSAGPPEETIRVYTSTTLSASRTTSATTYCYTEENINYDQKQFGMETLNQGTDIKTAIMEECRVYCRETYREAEYFTWRKGNTNNKCFCKSSKGAVKESSNVISGNVECK